MDTLLKSAALMAYRLLAVCTLAASAAHAAPTFTVNSPGDAVAAAPLNSGACETAPGNNVCTLRAAIMKANHFPGGGATIQFGLAGAVTYLLTIPASGANDETTGDLNITASMSIVGNGAANTIIDGNGSVTNDRAIQISFGATVTLSGVTIQHGRSTNIGGGIYNGGTLTLDRSAIINNVTTNINEWGGGIYNGATLTVTNSLIDGNAAQGGTNAHGGGIYSQGTLHVINSTISNNTVSGSPGQGGGIYLTSGAASITGSTISGNTAQEGGGIHKTGQPLTIIDSTISGNRGNVNGGGIYVNQGTAGLFNATVALNVANADNSGTGVGGGIFSASASSVNFLNSIIAQNGTVIAHMPLGTFQNDECSGTLASQGNNLVYFSDPANCMINGSVTYGDPNLGALQDNGGPTATHALLAGSPAIDAGSAGGCTDNLGAILTTDQRGFARVAGVRCDIGAFEFVAATLDVDQSMSASKYDALTDGLLVIRYLFGLTGTSLTNGALGSTATRTDPTAVKAYLDGIRTSLDVDGNGTPDALTDGLMVIRYLFGLRGSSLIAGAIGSGATRTMASQIETYLQTLTP